MGLNGIDISSWQEDLVVSAMGTCDSVIVKATGETWGSPLVFRYTGTGRIPGYGGHLNLDLFYGTGDDWRRLRAVAGASAGTRERQRP